MRILSIVVILSATAINRATAGLKNINGMRRSQFDGKSMAKKREYDAFGDYGESVYSGDEEEEFDFGYGGQAKKRNSADKYGNGAYMNAWAHKDAKTKLPASYFGENRGYGYEKYSGGLHSGQRTTSGSVKEFSRRTLESEKERARKQAFDQATKAFYDIMKIHSEKRKSESMTSSHSRSSHSSSKKVYVSSNDREVKNIIVDLKFGKSSATPTAHHHPAKTATPPGHAGLHFPAWVPIQMACYPFCVPNHVPAPVQPANVPNQFQGQPPSPISPTPPTATLVFGQTPAEPTPPTAGRGPITVPDYQPPPVIIHIREHYVRNSEPKASLQTTLVSSEH